MQFARMPRKASARFSRSALRNGREVDAMPLDGFDRLYQSADAQTEPLSVAAAGGDDPTVLEALQIAALRGWVRPIVVGPESRIASVASGAGISLDDFSIRHAEEDAIAPAAVSLVRAGDARILMKGRISTPVLMEAVLDAATG